MGPALIIASVGMRECYPPGSNELAAPDMPRTLSNARIRRLRGLCHDLSPVVTVADKGLTDNVRGEIESALAHHELVKIKLRAERDQRAEWTAAIIAETGAEPVQQIGQVLCLFRRNPENPKITLD